MPRPWMPSIVALVFSPRPTSRSSRTSRLDEPEARLVCGAIRAPSRSDPRRPPPPASPGGGRRRSPAPADPTGRSAAPGGGSSNAAAPTVSRGRVRRRPRCDSGKVFLCRPSRQGPVRSARDVPPLSGESRLFSTRRRSSGYAEGTSPARGLPVWESAWTRAGCALRGGARSAAPVVIYARARETRHARRSLHVWFRQPAHLHGRLSRLEKRSKLFRRRPRAASDWIPPLLTFGSRSRSARSSSSRRSRRSPTRPPSRT